MINDEISKKGGPSIQKELDKLIKKRGKVPVSQALITSAGSL